MLNNFLSVFFFLTRSVSIELNARYHLLCSQNTKKKGEKVCMIPKFKT